MSECNHDWQESYYGTHCTKCDEFHPTGCAPWDEEQDEPCCDYCGKPVYEFDELGCTACDARVKEMMG